MESKVERARRIQQLIKLEQKVKHNARDDVKGALDYDDLTLYLELRRAYPEYHNVEPKEIRRLEEVKATIIPPSPLQHSPIRMTNKEKLDTLKQEYFDMSELRVFTQEKEIGDKPGSGKPFTNKTKLEESQFKCPQYKDMTSGKIQEEMDKKIKEIELREMVEFKKKVEKNDSFSESDNVRWSALKGRNNQLLDVTLPANTMEERVEQIIRAESKGESKATTNPPTTSSAPLPLTPLPSSSDMKREIKKTTPPTPTSALIARKTEVENMIRIQKKIDEAKESSSDSDIQQKFELAGWLSLPNNKNYKDIDKINHQKMEAELKSELATMTSPVTNSAVRSKNMNSIVEDYKSQFSKADGSGYKDGYKEPVKKDKEITEFSFPTPEAAATFLKEQAKKGKEFTILDPNTNNVMAYSNGDGTLYHANTKKPYLSEEKIEPSPSDVALADFKIPERTNEPQRGMTSPGR